MICDNIVDENCTLTKFLRIKNTQSLTEFQAQCFGITRKNLTSGWKKRYGNSKVIAGRHEELEATIVSETRGINFLGKTENRRVYIIKNYSGHYKIGISNNILKRVDAMSVGSSTPLYVVRVYSCSYMAATIERKLHRRYKQYWMRGEWFNDRLNIEDVDKYILSLGYRIDITSNMDDAFYVKP